MYGQSTVYMYRAYVRGMYVWKSRSGVLKTVWQEEEDEKRQKLFCNTVCLKHVY